MSPSWTLTVGRDDLTRTNLIHRAGPEVGEGEALLRVDRVGVTANNVTYALLGDSLRYWDFFPAEPGWGVVPLWGFAEVAASAAEGVEVGTRVYGYLPSASHLLVRPGRVDARGFRDASPHRAELPSPYNVYAATGGDPIYQAEQEDLLILYRPLFYTSFMLADYLADNDFFGAELLALSSASSKTAYGAAFLLRGGGPEVVGLTSPGNVAFVESLGCYDRALPYDAVDRLSPTTPTCYLDFAGSAALRGRMRDQLADRLVREVIVGVTSQEMAGAGALAGPRTSVFFAPDQMRKRTGDWGRTGLDERFAEAWRRFAPTAERWIDIQTGQGPDALRAVWLDVLAGRPAPGVGNVLNL